MNSPRISFGERTFAKFHDSYWLLLFHHNSSGGVFFDSKTEATKSSLENKYSILYLLNDDFKTLRNGELKYEFLIEWPETFDFYFHWRQSLNPLYENDTIGVNYSEGFEMIHKRDSYKNFGGLVNDHNRTYTLLNGNPGSSDWCLAIGVQYSAPESWLQTGIPAACGAAETVNLWVKTSLFHRTNNCNKVYSHTDANNVCVMIFLVCS